MFYSYPRHDQTKIPSGAYYVAVVSEGNANAEKRYFVVLAANNDGKPWEAGLVYTRTELGNDTAETRYKRAQLLFRQLADAV